MQSLNEQTLLNVFWDLDGVIFKYHREDYVGDKPAYAQPGYFRNRESDENACLVFTNMASNDDIASLNVLSRGATRLPKDLRTIVVEDKKVCVKNRFPWLDSAHVFVTHDSKVESAEKILGRKLCKTDILIDDFNENIRSWEEAGGTSVKYINGLNTIDSYAGPKIVDNAIIDAPEWLVKIFEKSMR